MLGKKIWNSLTSSFQIDIQGSRSEFLKQEEYDGTLLWDFIRRRVNPSTSVGASRFKDELETKKLSDFDNNVTKYNTWFDDTREHITKEEGEGYTEYLRALFRAYLTSTNKEFVDSIAAERRDWIQGKVGANYSHRDLMELGRLTYNNLVEDGTWETNPKNSAVKTKEQNFLALATELVKTLSNQTDNSTGNKKKNGDGDKNSWRYDNPDNLQEKVINGRTMKWCSKDCHRRPQWCGRRNCLNKAELAAAMKKKQEKGKQTPEDGRVKVSKDFKMALAALTTVEDFRALED
jgi:hypothetical protein